MIKSKTNQYVRYIEETRIFYGEQGYSPYQWTVNESGPLTSMKKPLSQCRVALVSTGGLYHMSQTPFENHRNDMTFRELPKDVDVKELSIIHYAYDHSDAARDPNCVFPIDRLRELETEGFIGEVATINYTMMGAIFRRTAIKNELALELVDKLLQSKVDVLLMIPA